MPIPTFTLFTELPIEQPLQRLQLGFKEVDHRLRVAAMNLSFAHTSEVKLEKRTDHKA